MRRPFIALLVAEALSMTGSQLAFLTVPWFVLTTTGSEGRTGLASLAEMTPYVAAGLLGGPLIDRFGSFRSSVVADSASAVVVTLVPALYLADLLSFPLLLVLVAAAGALRGIGDTSKRTLLPRVAEAAGVSLDRAAALHDGVNRGAMLAGLPLAGLLIEWVGAANVLYIDAASFLISALLLGGLARTAKGGRADSDEPAERYRDSLLLGLGYLRRDRLLLVIVGMLFLTNLFDQAYSVIFVPVWVRDVVGDVGALGLLGGAFGLGAVVGSVAYAAAQRRLSRWLTLAVCFLLGGSSRLYALLFSEHLGVVVAVSFLAGVFMAVVNPILAASAYERVPQGLQGRVIGAIGSLSWAGIPIGGLLAGVAVENWGRHPALFVAATAYLLATLTPFVLPTWRQLDRRSEVPPSSRTL